MSGFADVSRDAANFRFMMNAFADEYMAAVCGDRGRYLIEAIRSYINLVEASMPQIEKREATP